MDIRMIARFMGRSRRWRDTRALNRHGNQGSDAWTESGAPGDAEPVADFERGGWVAGLIERQAPG